LVRFVRSVALVESFQRIGDGFALSPHKKIIGYCNSLPALVPVHGIVAAYYRCDPCRGTAGIRQESFHVSLAAARIGIAAIGEGMNEYVLHAILLGQVAKGFGMATHAMYSTVGQQSHQV